MSDYIQSTDFSSKDLLPRGHPNKIIKGSEFDSEFDAIATAIASKYDSSDLATEAQAQAESSNAVLMTPLRVANWADANAGIVGDLQALADPNADRLLFWDDSAGAAAFLSVGSNLSLSGTTLDVGANVALKNAPNVFDATQTISTSSVAVLNVFGSGSDMRVSFQHLGAPENQGRYTWVIQSNGTLALRTVQDSGSLSGAGVPLQITRSALEVTEVELNATTLDFNGDADISGSLTVGGTATFTSAEYRRQATSFDNLPTEPQEYLSFVWEEGNQNLGAGEGIRLAMKANMVTGPTPGADFEFGNIQFRKGDANDSSMRMIYAVQLTPDSDGTPPRDVLTIDGFTGEISGNGSGLTNLNASNLSSGTVPSDRLPSTIGGNKTFSNNVTVSGALTAGSARIASEGGVLFHDNTNNLGGKIVLSSSPATSAAQVGSPGDMRFVYS